MGCAARQPIRVDRLPLQQPSAQDVAQSKAVYQFLVAQQRKWAEKEPRSVIALLDEVIAQYPDSATAHWERAKIYVRLQDWPAALRDAERATRLDAERVDTHLFYARLLTFQERTDDAFAVLESIRRRHPAHEEVYTTMVRMYLQREDYSAVERILKQLLRHDPKNYTAQFYLGNLYDVYLDKPALAERTYKRAIELEPRDPKAYNALAEMYLEQERLEDSLATFLKIESHYVGDVAVQLRMAVLHYELGDHAAAIARLQTIVTQRPQEYKLQYYLGVIQEEAGLVQDAVASYRAIPPGSEYYKDAQLRLVAFMQMHGGGDGAAVAVLERALKRNALIPEFYQFLAHLHQSMGNDGAAEKVLRKAVRRFPERVDFPMSLALHYEQQGKSKRALPVMRKVLRIDPRNVTALNYVGYMLAESGRDLDEAETMLRTALELQPGDGHVVDSLAWVYFQKRDYAQAAHYIQLADQLQPGNPVILRHWAEIAFAQGDSGLAQRLLQQAQHIWLQQSKPDERELKRIAELLALVVA